MTAERKTPTDRRTPRCRYCGMPCATVVPYSRERDMRDFLLRGSYCSTDCLLGAFDAFQKYAGKARRTTPQ